MRSIPGPAGRLDAAVTHQECGNDQPNNEANLRFGNPAFIASEKFMVRYCFHLNRFPPSINKPLALM